MRKPVVIYKLKHKSRDDIMLTGKDNDHRLETTINQIQRNRECKRIENGKEVKVKKEVLCPLITDS